jgi:hypothetical protein
VKYRVEVEQRRFGWVEIEAEPGEPLSSISARAKSQVDDTATLPYWTDDATNVVRRIFEEDAPCVLRPGEPVRWCGTHDEPMKKGLDICWLRAYDPDRPDGLTEWWR